MKVPLLNELPPPPPGKVGWPWTCNQPLMRFDPVQPLPKISIVTPSYNQGAFLEETIRSILLQGYPNLEYIIMDAASKDQSVEIIKKYEPWISYWVSEKDRGQPHAINKGWRRATGDIVAWLNSDDWYQPNALWTTVRLFEQNPKAQWLVGAVDNRWEHINLSRRFIPRPTSLAQCLGRFNHGFHQPGVFWRRSLIEQVGLLDESFRYCFDQDFWARTLLQNLEPVYTEDCLAGFRVHLESKSCAERTPFMEEDWAVFRRYQNQLSGSERRQVRHWLRAYEAEFFLDQLYRFLAQKDRGGAIRYLISKLHLCAYLKPRKLALGALHRTLITGTAPAWCRHVTGQAGNACAPSV